MKSILQKDKTRCYICGSSQWLEEHHIFGGNPNRKLSEKYGLKVHLCHYCHNEPPEGIHHNADNNRLLKANAQKEAMLHYGWSIDDFRRIYGKSYL